MTIAGQYPSDPNLGRVSSSFELEASTVLRALRISVASALADVGNFAKPADVFKTLQVDRTLARQLFRLASGTESIANGGIIPSKTSIDRFLTAVAGHGVGEARVRDVKDAYIAFERLVQEHAGDRATFNSMVSATGEVDEEWLATDVQHRRNAFRAMSHALGVQAKTSITTYVVNGSDSAQFCDTAYVGGFTGLRVLRPLPNLRVFGATIYGIAGPEKISAQPLGLSEAGDGYLLEAFSTSPLPALTTDLITSPSGDAREIFVDKPVIGNAGASTLMFGNVYRKVPLNSVEPLHLHMSGSLPVETVLFDILIASSLRGNCTPTGRAVLGFRDRLASGPIELKGKFEPDYLGKGVESLSTPEIPKYCDMLNATANRLGWKLQTYNAWRVRVDFPLYQSTVTVAWDPI